MACLTVRPLHAGDSVGHACYRYISRSPVAKMRWAWDLAGNSWELLRDMTIVVWDSKRGLSDENRLDKPPS